MNSRDNRGNRGLKVLSRDDRESDRDRDRDRRRDRDRGERRRGDERDRDRPRGEGHNKPVQGPIVLLKRPDSKANIGSSGSQNDVRGDNSSKSVTQTPTQILKKGTSKRDQETGDSQQQSAVDKNKAAGPPPLHEVLKPPYRFPEPEAMALIDFRMKMCPWKTFNFDGGNSASNMDYFVISVIGRPNVGKSTILSYLAGNEKFGARNIFIPRCHEEEMQSSIYITSDQIVFIEMSSIYNQAATNELIPLVSQQGVLEVSNVTWNLRLIRWALSVSHLVLIVSENVLEPSLFQLMNSAEVIHSMDSALGEGLYPEPVYICNKAELDLLDNTEKIKGLENHFASITGRTRRIAPNYFVLPHIKYYDTEYEIFEDFKSSILGFNRFNRAPFASDREGLSKIIQKNNIQDWYQNALRLWDDMNNPSYFSAYVKLLP